MNYNSTAIRKRPMSFDTLKGQKFVVSTLKTAIETGRIAHSYLFSGPRGVGKTTSARLLAKALCCEKGPTITPCGKCNSCVSITNGSSPDVIEIDGASNTSVDDVRKIKEELMFPPQYSRYKIYIIDEVHMLSNSAFNALLKTIEEPPEWAIFIFATTELQKVPLTVQSRCQCFRFRSIDENTIADLIRNVAKEDAVKIDEESIKWIAKRSRGGARDAYTIFDQCVSFTGGNITFDKVKEELGITGASEIKAIFESAIKGDVKNAIEKLNALYDSGINSESFTLDATSYLRDMLLISNELTEDALLYNSIENYDAELIKTLRTSAIETALEKFLDLYRNLKYSLNARFETECAVSSLRNLPYIYSNTEIIKQLELLKKALVDEASSINPSLLIERQKQTIGSTIPPTTISASATAPTASPTAMPLSSQNTENSTPTNARTTIQANRNESSSNPFSNLDAPLASSQTITQNAEKLEPQSNEEDKEQQVIDILRTTNALLYQAYRNKLYFSIENNTAFIGLPKYSQMVINKTENIRILKDVLNRVYGNVADVQFIVKDAEVKKTSTVVDNIAKFFEGRVL